MVRKMVVREEEKAEKGLYLEIKVPGERVGRKRLVGNLSEGLQLGKRDGEVFNENQEGEGSDNGRSYKATQEQTLRDH